MKNLTKEKFKNVNPNLLKGTTEQLLDCDSISSTKRNNYKKNPEKQRNVLQKKSLIEAFFVVESQKIFLKSYIL